MKKKKTFNILSIDGGGIRGAFVAQMLYKISELTKSNLSKEFDLFIGTSTGSIIAASLAQHISPIKIVKMYKETSSTIFARKHSFTPIFLEKALRSPYDDLKFKIILKKVLSKVRIKDVHKNLIVVSTNLTDGMPYIFKSFDVNGLNCYLYEAIAASCAAPTFFDPIKLENKLLADGGIFANNPSLLAYTSALNDFHIEPQNIRILSIGCGYLNNCYEESKHWGLVNGWKVRILTDFVASLQSESNNVLLEKLLLKDNLLRLNFPNINNIASDDFNAVNDLIDIANNCFNAEKKNILNFFNNM